MARTGTPITFISHPGQRRERGLLLDTVAPGAGIARDGDGYFVAVVSVTPLFGTEERWEALKASSTEENARTWLAAHLAG